MNSKITIRKYRPEDHEEVNKLVRDGSNGHIKNGIMIGIKKPRVSIYLFLSFLLGSIFSFYCGIFALIIGLSIHSASVYFLYMTLVW